VEKEEREGNLLEGEDRQVRLDGGRALEARKLKRAHAPGPD